MTEMPSPGRSSLTPEIRALLQVPDDTTLAERQRQSTRERRMTGLWLGLALGLVYGAVSQSINHFYLPDLPLYYPAPGPWLTALLSMLLGGLLGWVGAWPENGVLGILFSGMLGALAMDAATVIEILQKTGGLEPVGTTILVTALLLIALPMVAVLAVVVALFRWALDFRQRLRREKSSRLLIHGIPLLLLALIGWLATSAAYPHAGRVELTRTRDLIEEGRWATQTLELPSALSSARVDDFLAHAQNPYTLQWDRDPTNRYAIPRPAGHSGEDALVIARFTDGWTLVCLYTWVSAPPQCISLEWQPPLNDPLAFLLTS